MKQSIASSAARNGSGNGRTELCIFGYLTSAFLGVRSLDKFWYGWVRSHCIILMAVMVERGLVLSWSMQTRVLRIICASEKGLQECSLMLVIN